MLSPPHYLYKLCRILLWVYNIPEPRVIGGSLRAVPKSVKYSSPTSNTSELLKSQSAFLVYMKGLYGTSNTAKIHLLSSICFLTFLSVSGFHKALHLSVSTAFLVILYHKSLKAIEHLP